MNESEQLAIESRKLFKSFKSYKKEEGLKGALKSFVKRNIETKVAVDAFDLLIKKGEIVGLLGPNGAGKTTLMKMFTGIIVPSCGDLKVLGFQPSARANNFRKKIALVMGQKSQLWWDIPAIDSFRLLQRYYEIPNKDFDERINEMGDLLQIKKLMHVQVRKLSLGERMKLELMASLIHSPEIIFLDEPTIGLDLVAQENIRGFIKEYHKKTNATVLVTSHYMTDVKELCNRIVLILDGKKSFDGSISAFEQILGNEKNVTFNFSQPQKMDDETFVDYFPKWNDLMTQVDLRLSVNDLREVSIKILKNYPVIDFNTEKMPIERVMKTLMANPDILTKVEFSL